MNCLENLVSHRLPPEQKILLILHFMKQGYLNSLNPEVKIAKPPSDNVFVYLVLLQCSFETL